MAILIISLSSSSLWAHKKKSVKKNEMQNEREVSSSDSRKDSPEPDKGKTMKDKSKGYKTEISSHGHLILIPTRPTPP